MGFQDRIVFMESKIRFLSLNVSLKNNLAGLESLLKVHKLDIILLQEVRINDDQIDILVGKHGFKGKVNINPEEPSLPGTAIVWRSCLPVREISTIVTCRAQCAFIGAYAFLNIYAPSGSDKKYERGSFFAKEIFRTLALHDNSSWILGGDFNCVLKPIDVENGTGFQQKKCVQLDDLVKALNLQDAFRHLHPAAREYTFFRASATPSRLDRFYLSSALLPRLILFEHVAALSDHCGAVMELLLQNVGDNRVKKVRITTYWKLNAAILSDEDFLHNFAGVWSGLKTKQVQYNEIADWWDSEAKPGIRDFCIEFSQNRSIRRSDSKKFLLAYLKLVLRRRDWPEVSRVKGKLEDLLQEDAYGYVVRSRFQNNSSEEVASLFHANREVKNAKKNNICSLKVNDEVINDPKKIESEVTEYFHALFNGHHRVDLTSAGVPFVPDNSGIDDFLVGLSALPDVVRDGLTNDMTMDDLEFIVKDCQSNKSP